MSGDQVAAAEEIAAILKTAPAANGHDVAAARIALVPFIEMTEPDLRTRKLVAGLLDAETFAVAYGPPGCGKTYLILDMALAVASGREWFGRRVRRGRVVYVAAEAGNSVRNRIAAWARIRWDKGEVDFSVVVSPVDLCHVKDGDAKGDAQQLALAIGAADLVVIDTVSRALAGGDENSPADMGAFVSCMDKLRKHLKTAIIAVHHIGKDASRGARGHSLLKGAVDTELAVEQRDDGVRVVTVTKQRDMQAGDELAFVLRQVELGRDQDDQMVTSCVVDPADYVPAAKEKELSQSLKAALDVLHAVVRQKSVAMPGDMLRHGVKIEDWRVAMLANGRFGEDKSSQFRTAWSRARNDLANLGKIRFGEGYVWPDEGNDIDDIPF